MIRLNHIGIAAADVPALEKLFSILGLSKSHIETVPDQGVKTHFLPVSPDQGGSHLELLEVVDPQSTVGQFIRKRGPGIHHLSFTVEKGKLASLCQKLRDEGF